MLPRTIELKVDDFRPEKRGIQLRLTPIILVPLAIVFALLLVPIVLIGTLILLLTSKRRYAKKVVFGGFALMNIYRTLKGLEVSVADKKSNVFIKVN